LLEFEWLLPPPLPSKARGAELEYSACLLELLPCSSSDPQDSGGDDLSEDLLLSELSNTILGFSPSESELLFRGSLVFRYCQVNHL